MKLKFGKKKKETPMSPVVESKELLPEEDKVSDGIFTLTDHRDPKYLNGRRSS